MKKLLFVTLLVAAFTMSCILSIKSVIRYKETTSLLKENLSALTDDEGDPVVLPCIRAELQCTMTIIDKDGNEYYGTLDGFENKE